MPPRPTNTILINPLTRAAQVGLKMYFYNWFVSICSVAGAISPLRAGFIAAYYYLSARARAAPAGYMREVFLLLISSEICICIVPLAVLTPSYYAGFSLG